MRRIWMGLLMLVLAGGATLATAQDRWRDRDRAGESVVVFDVIRTRFETRPCEQCEYRREGHGDLGVFRVETRLYHEYRHGHQVTTWEETEEFFDHCVPPRGRFPLY